MDSKKRFDPFCRWERIKVPIQKDSIYCFETTIGQLNFFKWSIENNIIEYIKNNYKEIENDMQNSLKNNYYNKGKNKKKIRRELSVSSTKTINKTQNKTIINFN